MRILLTGGAGFIGSSLINRLINEGNEIIIYDNFERNSIKFYDFENKIKIIKCDIVNFENLQNCLKLHKEPDVIIHLAAICGVDNVIKRPIKTLEVNTIGTYNLLNYIVKNNFKLKRLINFSSSEVYGSYSFKTSEEESTNIGVVGEARWGYSISKLMNEHLCFAFQKENNIPIVSIRPFNVYGPKQIGEGAIHLFIMKCLRNEDLEIHGNGSQIRSWCYIDDAIDFIYECINNESVTGQILNMGNPLGSISVIALAQKIIEITKSKSKIRFVEKPYIDIDIRVPNIEKSKKLFNFNPQVSLEEGILNTFLWYKNNSII